MTSGFVDPGGESTSPPGIHLVGSIPLGSAEEVFRAIGGSLGPWVRRMPDGETGLRSDWIVWQYPVLSSRPQFEVCPPGAHHYRALPRLRVRDGEHVEAITLGSLGYAEAAISSYRTFATLKRDGVVPPHCRFQVSLPTPLAPISAFVADENQATLERIYEAQMLREVSRIVDAIPSDQLAIQWDANFEFGMLEGVLPVWFPDVSAGIMERLLRLGRHVPADIDLGYHLCYGDEDHRDFVEPKDSSKLVEIANALSTGLERPLNWIHMPVPRTRTDADYFEPLSGLVLRPETELYLGVVHLADGVDGARQRSDAARRIVDGFGVSTECGWGRRPVAAMGPLVEIHTALSAPLVTSRGRRAPFSWPGGVERIPDEDWTRQAVDEFGLAYDKVGEHGWYSNLDHTVEEVARNVRDGDILLDYSGGTGIFVDRLKLRIFDFQIGMLIVDSSPKFLRVALEKYRDDPRVGLRLLRFLKEEGRLQQLDEILEPPLLARGFDAITSTNAIHLYSDLAATTAAWAQVLRPGGKVFINSGNIRNPRARTSEWILDETVWVINEVAEGLVRTDPSYAAYREDLDDIQRMKAHAAFRDRVFLEPRPLDFYTDMIEAGGLDVIGVHEESIRADVDQWLEFLSAYHGAVLGWLGGTEKVDGRAPTPEAVEDRIRLLRQSMRILLGGRPEFKACWTYITCRRP